MIPDRLGLGKILRWLLRLFVRLGEFLARLGGHENLEEEDLLPLEMVLEQKFVVFALPDELQDLGRVDLGLAKLVVVAVVLVLHSCAGQQL